MYTQMPPPENVTEGHRHHISEMIMAMMGVDRLAYIRACEIEGYRVFAADGTELACFESQEEAISTIHQFNLMPASVH